MHKFDNILCRRGIIPNMIHCLRTTEDQRNNRFDKKGLNGDTSPTQCLVCCNARVENDEKKAEGLKGMMQYFVRVHVMHGYIEGVHVSARTRMKHLQSRNHLISVPLCIYQSN